MTWDTHPGPVQSTSYAMFVRQVVTDNRQRADILAHLGTSGIIVLCMKIQHLGYIFLLEAAPLLNWQTTFG